MRVEDSEGLWAYVRDGELRLASTREDWDNLDEDDELEDGCVPLEVSEWAFYGGRWNEVDDEAHGIASGFYFGYRSGRDAIEGALRAPSAAVRVDAPDLDSMLQDGRAVSMGPDEAAALVSVARRAGQAAGQADPLAAIPKELGEAAGIVPSRRRLWDARRWRDPDSAFELGVDRLAMLDGHDGPIECGDEAWDAVMASHSASEVWEASSAAADLELARVTDALEPTNGEGASPHGLVAMAARRDDPDTRVYWTPDSVSDALGIYDAFGRGPLGSVDVDSMELVGPELVVGLHEVGKPDSAVELRVRVLTALGERAVASDPMPRLARIWDSPTLCQPLGEPAESDHILPPDVRRALEARAAAIPVADPFPGERAGRAPGKARGSR